MVECNASSCVHNVNEKYCNLKKVSVGFEGKCRQMKLRKKGIKVHDYTMVDGM